MQKTIDQRLKDMFNDDKLRGQLRSYALRITRHGDAADELQADIFLVARLHIFKLWNAGNIDLGSLSHIRAILFRITRNLSLEWRREAALRSIRFPSLHVESENLFCTDQESSRHAIVNDREDLDRFMSGLCKRDQEIIELRGENLNQEQIAYLIGINRSIVCKRLQMIKKRIRRGLD